ncbi:Kringle-like fold, partial [Trinorchestia longiramus]
MHFRGSSSVSQGRMFGLIPDYPVLLRNPNCTGTEAGLAQCPSYRGPRVDDKASELHLVVAGVRCTPNPPSECDPGGVRWGQKCFYASWSTSGEEDNAPENRERSTRKKRGVWGSFASALASHFGHGNSGNGRNNRDTGRNNRDTGRNSRGTSRNNPGTDRSNPGTGRSNLDNSLTGHMTGRQPVVLDHSLAKDYCEERGHTLVTIRSQEENDFVSELLRSLPTTSGVGGYHTAGVRTSLLGDTFWLWQDNRQPPAPQLPFLKWWPGWNSTGSRDSTAVYSTPGSDDHAASTLCVLLRETYPASVASGDKVHADYFWWELGSCDEELGILCEGPPKDVGCVVGRGASYRGPANTTSTGAPCVAPPPSSMIYSSTEYLMSLFNH